MNQKYHDMSALAHRIYHHDCSRNSTDLERAAKNGMIPKSELIDGEVYVGHCRNAYHATWHADRQRFEYERTKWGSKFMEDIVHPADDLGWDIFVPVCKLSECQDAD